MVDGQLVLEDPDAYALIVAVGKCNCSRTLEMNAERIEHFRGRISQRGLSPADVVIVVLNVDDPLGGALADILMPNHPWHEFRERGEVPFARGLAGRDGIQHLIDRVDEVAAQKLREHPGVACVVMDHGVVEVFPV